MTTTVDTKFYEKKKSMNFYISLGFLFIIIISTIALYFYKLSIENNIISLDTQIIERQKSIEDIQSDPLVTIYSIYAQHKGLLDIKSKQSQVPLFVSHLKKNFIKYGIDAKGFEYNEGTVITSLSNQTTDSGYAYEKVVKFLRDYALDDKALFDIEMIEAFEGYDKIGYDTEFVLR